MECIHFLSEDAHEYLAKIPPRHWSRHAFTQNCKSNMLLNNLCETFNAVIKDARDKPILTQMEWLRRYMMKRNNDKWEAAKKVEGKFMPYVQTVFDGLEKLARSCIVQQSRDDNYEVQLKGDQCVVDLEQRTCSCYQWELTGIPCVHAFACMLEKRVDPELYVHPYYSKETYLLAYESPIKPMPGPKHWEKVNMRQPLPPAFKVQPGRPKGKKRKLEKGEGKSQVADEAKKPKRKNQCKNCGGFGHYAKTCKIPSTTESRTTMTNVGRPPLQTPWVKEQRKKNEERIARKASSQGAGPNSIANKTFPQEVARQASTSTAPPPRNRTTSKLSLVRSTQ
ncbi:uncharacterized protein [Spinacia oleracea]|uniref:SWIM-type domain-containing protein n=2 Tax=Spinacia oleracea TaxID=3562 RepID=A0ABM3RJW9_SPIOL|nr:uncharacterized protein LOC130470231 [Spinacia oleracea]